MIFTRRANTHAFYIRPPSLFRRRHELGLEFKIIFITQLHLLQVVSYEHDDRETMKKMNPIYTDKHIHKCKDCAFA